MAHYGNYHDGGGYAGQYDPPYPMQQMQTPTMASDDGYGVDHNHKAARQHGQYQHLGDGGAPVLYVEEPRRRSCMDKLCCGCCVCLPKWIRYICCIILLLIICIAIVIGVLAGIFKVPDVKFNGIQGEPQFSINGTTANFVFNLNITIDNPNVESITFEDVVAKAYYPGHDQSIGGGKLNDVHIKRYDVTEIIFPFTLSVDAKDAATQSIIMDMMGKCGLTGGEPSDITINYDVVPTVNIIGIKISPTISNKANLPCNSNDIPDLSSITQLTSLIPSDVVPTSGA
ncbi:hypothetical protein K492DRAFT_166871 [Lichtheimia hyalospora FSU 10163]|nr:hypothetical protein K492DRAFT_166871 [Lichtheimia hyalospora FSU 10163]